MNNNVAFVVMSNTTIGNGATAYSTSYPNIYGSGYAAVYLKLEGSSSVTVTQQASVDNSNFFDVVSSSGGALGAVVSAATSTAGVYIQFDPVVARYHRFKVVTAAASTVGELSVVSGENV